MNTRKFKRIVWDIETNGLLDTMDTLHCICVKCIESGETQSFYGDGVQNGLRLLTEAEEIIGHNIIAFDIPAIRLVYPDFLPTGRVTDTLVLSRLMKADIKNEDFEAYNGEDSAILPRRLFGSHSLAAWGLRMGNHKGDYEGGWDTFTDEMLKYCEQDVEVTHSLLKHLDVDTWDDNCIRAEHRIHEICTEVGNYGWTLDVEKATKLYADLVQRRIEIEDNLGELFEPWVISEVFIPKVNNSKLGYEKGVPFTKKKTVHFNPNSRRHIEHCLRTKYNWKPTKMTEQGHAQIDDVILATLDYPEAKILAEYFMLQKRIGQLAEGKAAWLKLVNEDTRRIGHTIVCGGTVSGRASHRSPNLAQVPAVRLPYGRECRELFTVDEGYSLVGADLSGIELRCLAHFMKDHDYINTILEGDIHTENQKAAGLPTRDAAKTFIFSLIYGAGDQKLGTLVGGGMQEGRALRSRIMSNLPAFKRLKTNVDQAAKKGYLIGIDKRYTKVRSAHAAFNTLLQSTAATIARHWVIHIYDEIKRQNIDAHILAWVHDEVQIAVKKGHEEDVGNITRRMAQEVGEKFNFNIRIDSEFGIGANWAETH